MAAKDLESNIEDVFSECGRPGICVMIATGGAAEIRETNLVPHGKVCVSTERLLMLHGLTEGLAPTHDLDNPAQHTLWLPPENVDTLVHRLWDAFRGPFVKEDLTDACTTDDLRGLQHPGS